MRQNNTGEITSVPIRASQAEICYWAPYSLCGTKAKQKVSKTLQVRTEPTARLDSPAALLKERTSRTAIPLHRPAESCLPPRLVRHLSATLGPQTFQHPQLPDEVKD
ncbi:hypothetical protein GCM10010319_12850 [Streptomyces blastmyceticus]|uniref:Uncharacterized protein n=1 Tax=Streptomyces blastmyceticus TaxID=68180 RepID=A0ABP3G8M8_9ACTN